MIATSHCTARNGHRASRLIASAILGTKRLLRVLSATRARIASTESSSPTHFEFDRVTDVHFCVTFPFSHMEWRNRRAGTGSFVAVCG
jgi:hypothetical protein